MFNKDTLLNWVLFAILISAMAMAISSCASKKVMKNCDQAQGGLFVCEDI